MALQTVSSKVPSKEIVTLGFEPGELYLNQLLSGKDARVSWRNIQDISQIAPLIHHRSGAPYAIICHSRFLQQSGFSFVHRVSRNPSLKHIPFVVLGPKDQSPLERIAALQNGVDDFYFLGMEWSVLNERISFIRELKEWSVSNEPRIEETFVLAGSSLKRMIDIILSSAGLICLSPLLLLIALLIKLESRGPVIYRSRRVGEAFQAFDFLKFRTMCRGADKVLSQLRHQNHYDKHGASPSPVFYKIRDDHRITRLGKILRSTGLDELPQLVNVLKGDMSIVGNRPLPEYEANEVIQPKWIERYLAPAGITGLWQVSKNKNTMTPQERIRFDIQYARNPSLLTDLAIIIKTLPAMLRTESDT